MAWPCLRCSFGAARADQPPSRANVSELKCTIGAISATGNLFTRKGEYSVSTSKKGRLYVPVFELTLLFLASLACGGTTPVTPTRVPATPSGETPAAPTVTSAPPTELTGNVVKAPLVGATVDFYALNEDGAKGRLLGSTTTDASGSYTVTLNPGPTGPILAEASGGSYVDEWTGVNTVLTSTDILTAALPAGTQRATVNPVTHMAATRARVMAAEGIPLATAVDAANVGVAGLYGIPDTIGVLPAPATNADELSMATWVERTYGIILGGIARSAANLDVRAIDLGQALADDLSDGVFDGKNGTGIITVPTIGGGTITLPATAGIADLQEAIDLFVASNINKTNVTVVQISRSPLPIQFGVNDAGRLYVTSTVLPAWTENQFGSTKLTAAGGVPPHQCFVEAGSLPVGFSLNGCVLSGTPPVLAGGTTMTITAPFTVTITDSASPPTSASVEFRITILRAGPTVTPIEGTCFVNVLCKTLVAVGDGGTPPYAFTHDTFANDPPPLGTVILTSGELSGTIKTEGTYRFSICVVDNVGEFSCDTTSVIVVKENPLAKYNGSYTGSYSGSHPYGTETGSVNLVVTDGAITGTATGAITALEGSVDATGSASLTVSGECAGTAIGTFSVSDTGVSVSGTFSCTASAFGVTVSGTWSATRQ